MMPTLRYPILVSFLSWVFCFDPASSAWSQTLVGHPGVIWSDAPGNYDQAELWASPVWGGTTGIPNSGANAFIFNGDLTVASGGNFNPNQLVLGWEPWHTGKFTQTGGTVRTESWTRVGWSGNTQLNQSGGTFSASDLMVGWLNWETGTAAATGTLNQTGGTFETRNIAYVGLQGGTGIVNVSAGTNKAVRTIVGWLAGGNGTVNVSGGRVSAGETTFVGFDGGTGVLNISGGEYAAGGNASPGFDGFGSFRIADFGVGTGTVNLSGSGLVNASRYTAVGGWGNGTLNISGGTWNQAAGGIVVGDAADLTWTGRGDVNQSGGTVNTDAVLLQKGTYNLNGGMLYTYAVADTKAETTGVFNLNGGTLIARDNNTNFIQADTVEIKSGGATINTTDKEVWVTKGMGGTGGLTKAGSGILRLDGANTYTGTTTVSQGTLTVNGSLAGGVNVASGSLLKGSGTIGGASSVNGTLAAGNSPGQITFSSDLTLGSGSNLVWELFGNTSSDVTQFDRIAVGGNLLASAGSGITLDFGTTAGGSTVDWSNAFWDSAQSWTFLAVAGSTTGFSNLSLLNGSFLDASGNSLATARSGATFSLTQSGSNVMISYIPEPSTGSLLLMGLASWALVRAGSRRSA